MILNLEHSTLNEKKILSKKYQKQITEISAKLHNPDHSAGTTWVDWPVEYDKKEFAKIQKLAKTISSNSLFSKSSSISNISFFRYTKFNVLSFILFSNLDTFTFSLFISFE